MKNKTNAENGGGVAVQRPCCNAGTETQKQVCPRCGNKHVTLRMEGGTCDVCLNYWQTENPQYNEKGQR